MATIKRFEDLEVWQLARQLNKNLIPSLTRLTETRNYELKNQLDSAAGSVMDNIAEGFERDGNREFTQFLAIAKGSLGEVRSQMYRVFDRNVIAEKEFKTLYDETITLAGKIGAFITYLKKSEYKGSKYRIGN